MKNKILLTIGIDKSSSMSSCIEEIINKLNIFFNTISSDTDLDVDIFCTIKVFSKINNSSNVLTIIDKKKIGEFTLESKDIIIDGIDDIESFLEVCLKDIKSWVYNFKDFYQNNNNILIIVTDDTYPISDKIKNSLYEIEKLTKGELLTVYFLYNNTKNNKELISIQKHKNKKFFIEVFSFDILNIILFKIKNIYFLKFPFQSYFKRLTSRYISFKKITLLFVLFLTIFFFVKFIIIENIKSTIINIGNNIDNQCDSIRKIYIKDKQLPSGVIVLVNIPIKPTFNFNFDNDFDIDINYEISFPKDLEYRIEDYPLGKYELNDFKEGRAILEMFRKTFLNELVEIHKNSQTTIIRIEGEADKLMFNTIKYTLKDNIVNEECYVDDKLKIMSINSNTNITNNEQLAFIRGYVLRKHIENYVTPLIEKKPIYQHFAKFNSKDTGGRYRRVTINVKFIKSSL